jgi:outer membrane protein
MMKFLRTAFLAALLCSPHRASAQTPDNRGAALSGPPAVLTLDRAMQYAIDHYPAVRAAVEQVAASSAAVSIARSAYLPRLDALWQSSRATANNVFGQVLPQSVIPALTGPVLTLTSSQSVWGSAAGALFTWEPVDFGLRKAAVAGADAAVTQARAGEALTRLEVQSAVGSAFLNVVAAERAVVAAQADVDRRDALTRTVHALVDNQLRPGADASRADAEQAAARTRLIQSQQVLAIAQTTLARVLGVSGIVRADGEALIDRVPPGAPDVNNVASAAAGAPAAHPLAQARQAAVDAAIAQQQALARTDLPRVYLQSSVFARGSGANADGTFDGGAAGLGLERANWAAGFQIVFPNVFDFSSLNARKAAAAASARAETARHDEALLTITSERQAAATMVQAARAIAANTPVQVAAARQSVTQATARYQAGLASIVEVADAQSLAAQSETQDQIARVDVWRALLAQAVAGGAIEPFLKLIQP